MNKLIGVSSRTLLVDNVNKLFVNQRYLNYLDQYGLKYIILPLNLNEQVLSLCDGFLLTGGYDLNPTYFHQPLNPATILVDKEVDDADFQIIEHARKQHKPLFGICRGIQVINVGFNGSLYQDIKNHSNNNHQIITAKSRLIPDLCLVEVSNSHHHQAIDIMGDGLLVVGKTHDNIVEIIEHQTLPIIAVQFHPEINITSNLSRKIMAAFIHLLGL